MPGLRAFGQNPVGGDERRHACLRVDREILGFALIAGAQIEGRVGAAYWTDDGRLVHYSSCQGAHPARGVLAKVYGLPLDRVRVIVPDVGGGFGSKARPYPEEVFLGELARRVGRPVRWVETRTENMLALGHGRGQVQRVTIGGNRDGRITAMTGASPHGQGNETTFAQMLADHFSIPFEHVTILHGDTAVVKQGIGTFGSRSQAVGGAALHMAAGKVKVYKLNHKPLPAGWTVDGSGQPVTDPEEAFHYVLDRPEGGITPLGGTREVGSTDPNGTVFRLVEYAPGVAPRNHRTESIDYAVVMSG